MGSHSCERCGYNTPNIADMKKHLKRVKPCKDILGCKMDCSQLIEPLNAKKTIQCEYCTCVFDNKFAKYHHKKKKHPLNDTFASSQQDKLLAKVSELIKSSGDKQVVININTNITSNSNNTNTNTNNTQQTNNTQINAFGNESFEHVLKDKERLTKNYLYAANGFIKTAKDLYFNEEHPENKTVRITNKKLPFADTFDGQRWQTRQQQPVLKDMVNNVKNLLDEHVEEHKVEIVNKFRNNQRILQSAEKFRNDIKDALDDEEKMTPDQVRMFKNILKEMHILIFNNSSI